MKATHSKHRLTDTLVKGLEPPAKGYALLRDTKERGLALRVTATGAKSWVFHYSLGGEKRYTFAKYGPAPGYSVEAARVRVVELRKLVNDGIDPMELDRQREEEARRAKYATVDALLDQFLASLPTRQSKRRQGAPLRRNTVQMYERVVRLYIRPALGKLKTDEVRPIDIEKLHKSLAGKPFMANRVVEACKVLFRDAERLGLRMRGTNPATDVQPFPEPKRGASKAVLLQSRQIRQLLDAFDELEQEARAAVQSGRRAKYARLTLYGLAALRVGFWSGWRTRSEVLPLLRDDVDLATGATTLRDSKGADREHRVLPEEALEVLRRLEPIVGSLYFFPGKAPGSHLRTLFPLWCKVRERARLTDLPDDLGALRVHDMRHNAVSWSLRSGASLKAAGALVGHKSQASTEVYSHFADDFMRELANKRSAEMKAAVEKAKSEGRVLPFESRG